MSSSTSQGRGNEENGHPARRGIKTRSMSASTIAKLNSKNPIRATPIKTRSKKRKSTESQAELKSEENAVTSTTNQNSIDAPVFLENKNMSFNSKRLKVLTSPNSLSMGVPRFDSIDMLHFSDTYVNSPPRSSIGLVPFTMKGDPSEASRCLLNPIAALLKPSSPHSYTEIPNRSVSNPRIPSATPKPQERVRRNPIYECETSYFDDQTNAIQPAPTTTFINRSKHRKRISKSSVLDAKIQTQVRASSKFNKTINLSPTNVSKTSYFDDQTNAIQPAPTTTYINRSKHLKRISKSSVLDAKIQTQVRASSKFNKTINLSPTNVSKIKETEVIILDDSIEEKPFVISAESVPKGTTETPLVDLSFEEGELRSDGEDEVEIIGISITGGNNSNRQNVKASVSAKKSCTPKYLNTQRKGRRSSRHSYAHTPGKIKGGGLRVNTPGKSKGGGLRVNTPGKRKGGGLSVNTPGKSKGGGLRVKMPARKGATPALLERRRSLARNYGNTPVLRSPTETRVKALKRLGKSRWGSPLSTNRKLTRGHASNVSGWTERQYQQANEKFKKKPLASRRQTFRFARGGAGRSRNDHSGRSNNSRYLYKNPVHTSALSLGPTDCGDRGPVSRNPLYMVSENETRSGLFSSRNNEQSVPVVGMNIHMASTQPSDQQKGKLRPIVIDGSNVAMGHGNNRFFSCRGIKMCAEYFKRLGHETVLAFVPRYRTKLKESKDRHLLEELEREGIVKLTPSRDLLDGRRIASYDDRYVVATAAAIGGIIVSNDNFRDLLLEDPSLQDVIATRLLPFTWISEEILIFPPDPLGRHGPSLHEFLRF